MVELSQRSWAFMICSMLAGQLQVPVTMQEGKHISLLKSVTFSNLYKVSFVSLHRFSNLALLFSIFFFYSTSSGHYRTSFAMETRAYIQFQHKAKTCVSMEQT